MSAVLRRVALGSCLAFVSSATLLAQTTERVSVATSGAQGNSSSYGCVTTPDARFVAFASWAWTLVPGDTNYKRDVFVRDRLLGTTERVSVDSSGLQGNDDSGGPVMGISDDGRFVAFESIATNLVAGDTNGAWDVFVHDRWLGTTERMSVDSNGVQGNDNSLLPAISGDGRFVTFTSFAWNLVPDDRSTWMNVYVHDRVLGTTEMVNVATSGARSDTGGMYSKLSSDGRYVVFGSMGGNLVPGDTNSTWDVFVRDRLLGTTERVSVGAGGVQGNGGSGYTGVAISRDARFVVFLSLATNLAAGGIDGQPELFLRDRELGSTELVSLSTSGTPANGWPIEDFSVSDDGLYVAFGSTATNLVPRDTNGLEDTFVRNRKYLRTERVSVGIDGQQADGWAEGVAISADGHSVVFVDGAGNLVPFDTNGYADIFLAERDESGYLSLCDPGQSGVVACPCGNPPALGGSGCDNSEATGGARLAASGNAHVSQDTLVFETAGERSAALSVLVQGTLPVPAGMVAGQGVRCLAGNVKELFRGRAVLGGVVLPDRGAGDPSVSARSSSLGNPIQAGQSRWYLVRYRDPIVLGSCLAGYTFNVTQTMRVDWGP